MLRPCMTLQPRVRDAGAIHSVLERSGRRRNILHWVKIGGSVLSAMFRYSVSHLMRACMNCDSLYVI